MKALLVNETLNFNRDIKSPYAKIGLGVSFENLKPGAILKPKKIIYIGPRTNFISGEYGKKIWEESYAVVIDSEKTPLGNLKVWYYQAWDLKQAETVREDIELYNRDNSMTGSLKQFENRFEIVKN